MIGSVVNSDLSPATPLAVAIDGPVASGKSTVGRLVAERLGWAFLDTGLMYRAVGYLALAHSVSVDDEDALARLVQAAAIQVRDGTLTAEGRPLGDELRTEEAADASSKVAQLAGVRAALVARQREIAARGPVVMAGRDIGTVVLRDAPVKVYLTASIEERARRRYAEMTAVGAATTPEEVLEELRERDRRDQERTVAPLRPAEDAHLLDTTGLSIEEAVEAVLGLVWEARMDQRRG